MPQWETRDFLSPMNQKLQSVATSILVAIIGVTGGLGYGLHALPGCSHHHGSHNHVAQSHSQRHCCCESGHEEDASREEDGKEDSDAASWADVLDEHDCLICQLLAQRAVPGNSPSDITHLLLAWNSSSLGEHLHSSSILPYLARGPPTV